MPNLESSKSIVHLGDTLSTRVKSNSQTAKTPALTSSVAEADKTPYKNSARPRPASREGKCYTVIAGRENINSLINECCSNLDILYLDMI